MKNIKRRITALVLAGALAGALGVATSEVAEPAVVEVAQSIGIDLPSSAEPAQAALIATKYVYCGYDNYPRIQIRNTSGASVTVQIWSYNGAKYLGSKSVPPYTTATYSGYPTQAVQFRMYSSVSLFSYYGYCY